MVKRVLAWVAVIFGGFITIESVFIAHKPNLVWILVFLLGVIFLAKNGFLKTKPPKVS